MANTGTLLTTCSLIRRDRWQSEFKSPKRGLIEQKSVWEDYRTPTLHSHMPVPGAGHYASYPRPGGEFRRLCEEGQLDKALSVLLCMSQQGTVPSVGMYRFLLKECSRRKALAQAKRVHAHLTKHELTGDLGESVVITLVKCGGLADAVKVFNWLPQRTVYSWTAVISGYTMAGQGQEALALYQRMRGEGLEPNNHTFVSLLKACGSISDLEAGKRIHVETLKYGCQRDLFVGTSLVDMYARCGSIVDAQAAFDELSQRDAVSWNTMLGACILQGQPERTLQLYEQMLEEGGSPDVRTFVTALQACGLLAEKEGAVLVNGQLTKARSLKKGRAIHLEAWRRAYKSDAFVCSTLVSMYCKCGSILDSQLVFDGVSLRNVVSWNAMLAGYAQQGQPEKAFQVYRQMRQEAVSPDDRTFVSVLQACGTLAEMEEHDDVFDGRWIKVKSLGEGKAIHADTWRKGYDSDVFVGNSLISLYGKCASSLDMQIVFDGLPQRNMVSWTAMVSIYAQQEQAEKALEAYEQMLEEGISPNDKTFASVLQACGMLAEKENSMLVDGRLNYVESLQWGKAIHSHVWRKGFVSCVLIGNTLISMYGKCGCIVDAQSIFDGLCDRNVVSWNAMLKAYVDQGNAEKALKLYVQMQEEGVNFDVRTLISMLQVCGMLADKEEAVVDVRWMKPDALSKGKVIHAEAWKAGYKSDVFIGSALIRTYAKCKSISDAQNVFDVELHKRDLVGWNMMLAAYAQLGLGDKALQLYVQMQEEGVKPNEITFLCMLQVCSQTGRLEVCREIHQHLVSSGGNLGPLLGSSLINAYGRCASMVDAQNVLHSIVQPNVISWTSLIAGYARQGNWVKSLRSYEQMQLAGVKPNGVTFLSLLSACSHGGLVDKGVEYFVSMARDHCITPGLEHYVSVVDLLGRAGHFTRIDDILSTMPVKPDLSLLLCLLSACRKHGKVKLAEQHFKHAVGLSPKHAAAYVLMSNMYADAGLWDCAKEVDELRLEAGAWKESGQSWVGHEQEVHTFVVGEHHCPNEQQVYDMLLKLGF